MLRESKLILLETYQLYSRLISCTRRISILPWKLKCCVGVVGVGVGVCMAHTLRMILMVCMVRMACMTCIIRMVCMV